jgi:hypothetical protein
MAFPGEISRGYLLNVTAEITETVESGRRLPDGLGYAATVGMVQLSDTTYHLRQPESRATASFAAFDIAEVADSSRVVVFECPGGPISPAQAGINRTGPMVVEYHADGRLSDRPHLVPNEFTPLPVARLVYYDAPDTGYGRSKDPEHYYSVKRDAQAFSAFVETYLSINGLEDNPVVFAMSSYSTFRSSEAARLLAERGKSVGLVRINPLNDYAANVLQPGASKEQRGIGHPEDPRLYALPLPSLAATAKYHERLGEREQTMPADELFDEVREFANGIYTDALARPHALSAAEREEIVSRLERYTGLPRGLFEENLQVDVKSFTENLLNDKKQVVSTLDGRIALPKSDTVRIEPVVDERERILKGIIERYFADLGFPEEAIPEGGYGGIVQAYPKWGFDGKDWRDRSTYRVTANLLATGVSVVDLLGTYDLITPPGFAESYWKVIGKSFLGRLAYRDAHDPRDIGPGITVFRLPAGHNIGTTPDSREFLGNVIRTVAKQVKRSDDEHGSSVDSAEARHAEIISRALVKLASCLSRFGRDVDIGPISTIASKLGEGDDCRIFARLVDSVVSTGDYKDCAVELSPEMSETEAWLELLDELYNLLGGERPNQEKAAVERTHTDSGPMPYPNMRTLTASGLTIEETWYKNARRSNERFHKIEFIRFKAGSAADYI